MAPKSALLTAGTEDLKPKQGPPNKGPWTTREKQAVLDAKKSKQPVKRSLPPPGEMTEDAETERKKAWRKKKPRTTREKLKDAEEKRKATQGGQSKASANVNGDGNGKNGKQKEAKGEKYSVYKAVREQHIASTHQNKTKQTRPSVLVRPTERAKRAAAEIKRKIATLSDSTRASSDQFKTAVINASTEIAATSNTSNNAQSRTDWALFKLLDLPDIVRKRIWEFCVVYPDHFIWPEDKIDHEQPDLAMVSRRIRSEVLPIYYRQNTFAVALVASGKGKAGSRNEVNARGLAAIRKWGQVLEEKSWFNYIKNFAFDYTSLAMTDSPRGEEQDSMVVCVQIGRKAGMQALTVQVHRDARCLLPGRIEFASCRPSKNATWLDQLAAGVVKGSGLSKRISMSGKMLVELAEAIMAAAEELMEIRCKEASHPRKADPAVGDI